MAVYRRIVPLARDLEARLLADLGARERDALRSLLARLEESAAAL
jgi:DNA-binding MarR family transcriptional regulator